MEFPIGDGSNLTDPANNPIGLGRAWAIREWQFRRLFIRALHFPGLLLIEGAPADEFNTDRANYFIELYIAARILLDSEHLVIDRLSPQYNHDRGDRRWPDMRWIKASRTIIDTALRTMFTAAETAAAPAVVALVASETAAGIVPGQMQILNWNMTMAPAETAQAMQQVSCNRGKFPGAP
jgi:hypothetical protein